MEIIEGMRAAVKLAVKQKQHGCARSPAITEAGAWVIYWKSVQNSKRNNIPATDKAHRIAKRLGLPANFTEDAVTSDAEKHTRDSWKRLRSC